MDSSAKLSVENLVTGQSVDLELLDVIDNAVANCLSYVDALQQIIDFEKGRGLLGFHFSVDPFSNANNEEIAKEIIDMKRSTAMGEFEDVTNEVL